MLTNRLSVSIPQNSGSYGQSCYKHLCAGFCGQNVSAHLCKKYQGE